jgi:hypothetical protein
MCLRFKFCTHQRVCVLNFLKKSQIRCTLALRKCATGWPKVQLDLPRRLYCTTVIQFRFKVVVSFGNRSEFGMSFLSGKRSRWSCNLIFLFYFNRTQSLYRRLLPPITQPAQNYTEPKI